MANILNVGAKVESVKFKYKGKVVYYEPQILKYLIELDDDSNPSVGFYSLVGTKYGRYYWAYYTEVTTVPYDDFTQEKQVIVYPPGLHCAECKDFNKYANCNFGDKFICWSCKSSNAWKYVNA